jgi:hypothetical protein
MIQVVVSILMAILDKQQASELNYVQNNSSRMIARLRVYFLLTTLDTNHNVCLVLSNSSLFITFLPLLITVLFKQSLVTHLLHDDLHSSIKHVELC